jgi:hypothetical protein
VNIKEMTNDYLVRKVRDIMTHDKTLARPRGTASESILSARARRSESFSKVTDVRIGDAGQPAVATLRAAVTAIVLAIVATIAMGARSPHANVHPRGVIERIERIERIEPAPFSWTHFIPLPS